MPKQTTSQRHESLQNMLNEEDKENNDVFQDILVQINNDDKDKSKPQ